MMLRIIKGIRPEEYNRLIKTSNVQRNKRRKDQSEGQKVGGGGGGGEVSFLSDYLLSRSFVFNLPSEDVADSTSHMESTFRTLRDESFFLRADIIVHPN